MIILESNNNLNILKVCEKSTVMNKKLHSLIQGLKIDNQWKNRKGNRISFSCQKSEPNLTRIVFILWGKEESMVFNYL